MRSPARTTSFVMVLTGWMALSLAPLVALAPASSAAFAVLAAGLVAVATLRFSLRWGVGVAAVAVAVFALAAASGTVSPLALTGEDLERLGMSLLRGRTLVPDLLAAVSLLGTAGCAELASAGLEWDTVLRRAVRETRPEHVPAATPAVEPPRARAPATEPALVGAGGGGRPRRSPRRPRGKEEPRDPP